MSEGMRFAQPWLLTLCLNLIMFGVTQELFPGWLRDAPRGKGRWFKELPGALRVLLLAMVAVGLLGLYPELLVAALGLWLTGLGWLRWRHRLAARLARALGWQQWRRRLEARLAPPPRPAAEGRDRSPAAAAVAGILDHHLAAGTYRLGCHELSAALRSHWEEAGMQWPSGARLTRMTAGELGGRVGDGPMTRLLATLAELQFGRREPTREDFQGICEAASELVAKEHAA